MKTDKKAKEAAETAEFVTLVRQLSDDGQAKFLAWCEQVIADAEAARRANTAKPAS